MSSLFFGQFGKKLAPPSKNFELEKKMATFLAVDYPELPPIFDGKSVTFLLQAVPNPQGVIGVSLKAPYEFLVMMPTDGQIVPAALDVQSICDREFTVVEGNILKLPVGSKLTLEKKSELVSPYAFVIDTTDSVHIIGFTTGKDVSDEHVAKKPRQVIRRVTIDGVELSRDQTIQIFIVWCEYHNSKIAPNYGQKYVVWSDTAPSYRTVSGNGGTLRNFFKYDVATQKVKACARATDAIEAMEKFVGLSFYDDIEHNSAKYNISHILDQNVTSIAI